MDAGTTSSNVAPGFTVVRDETGLRTTMTITVRSCTDEAFEATLPVIPPGNLTDDSISSYRLSEGAVVEGDGLLQYYTQVGFGVAYSPAVIEVSEEVSGGVARGLVIVDNGRFEVTIDWTRSTMEDEMPATIIRTFVQDNEQDPPALLGYCDEHWSSRARTTLGLAVVNSDVPLSPIFVPPGNSVASGPAMVSIHCRALIPP